MRITTLRLDIPSFRSKKSIEKNLIHGSKNECSNDGPQ